MTLNEIVPGWENKQPQPPQGRTVGSQNHTHTHTHTQTHTPATVRNRRDVGGPAKRTWVPFTVSPESCGSHRIATTLHPAGRVRRSGGGANGPGVYRRCCDTSLKRRERSYVSCGNPNGCDGSHVAEEVPIEYASTLETKRKHERKILPQRTSVEENSTATTAAVPREDQTHQPRTSTSTKAK